MLIRKQVKITISEELYNHLKNKAEIIGISIPQFIKFAILKEAKIHGITNFDRDIRYLSKRVTEADLTD